MGVKWGCGKGVSVDPGKALRNAEAALNDAVRDVQDALNDAERQVQTRVEQAVNWVKDNEGAIVNGAVIATAKVIDAAGDFAEGLGKRASKLGKALKKGITFEIRSKAGTLLRSAGELAKNPFVRGLAKDIKGVPVLGIVTTGGEVVWDIHEGHSAGRALLKGFLSLALGTAGAALGTLVCGAGAIATLGAGALACPILAVGGGVGGSLLGDWLGDKFSERLGWN
jgi:hypothetical protein